MYPRRQATGWCWVWTGSQCSCTWTSSSSPTPIFETSASAAEAVPPPSQTAFWPSQPPTLPLSCRAPAGSWPIHKTFLRCPGVALGRCPTERSFPCPRHRSSLRWKSSVSCEQSSGQKTLQACLLSAEFRVHLSCREPKLLRPISESVAIWWVPSQWLSSASGLHSAGHIRSRYLCPWRSSMLQLPSGPWWFRRLSYFRQAVLPVLFFRWVWVPAQHNRWLLSNYAKWSLAAPNHWSWLFLRMGHRISWWGWLWWTYRFQILLRRLFFPSWS